jgi:hypothetical protein
LSASKKLAAKEAVADGLKPLFIGIGKETFIWEAAQQTA